MFGNGFYNPYMYQPYYQTANMARNIGGFARSGIGSAARSGIGTAARSGIGSAMGSSLGNSVGSSMGGGLAGGLGNLLSRFSLSGFLNGASKTLNVVNQAIPIFYQVRPMINNAKTMFRIMGAVKDDDSPKKDSIQETKTNYTSTRNVTPPTTTSNSDNRSVINESEFASENPVFFI